MRLGVVGHRGYDGLGDVLRRLTELSQRLDLQLAFEPDLHELAGSGTGWFLLISVIFVQVELSVCFAAYNGFRWFVTK